MKKGEALVIIRFIRRIFSSWLENADKEVLQLLLSELGQMKRAVSGRLKE